MMRHAGRVLVTGIGWQVWGDAGRASGTGDLATAREYVGRAMSGEFRNLETWRPGTPDEYVIGDVYALDWSHA